MFKSYIATQRDLFAIEEALRYVWDSKLDFVFQDKTVIRSTIVVSFDSKFVYLWSLRKFSNLSPIPCTLEEYNAYKIPHRLLIAKEFHYGWHAGITPEIERLLPDTIKNSSRFSVPLISGGLVTPFITLQKSFRKKNNPYTTRKSYLATIVHEFGHVYWNQYKLWWYSNKEENLRYLKTAMKFYSNKKSTASVTQINLPVNQGIGEAYAFCTEYFASSLFWPTHKKMLDEFVQQILFWTIESESKINLETEDSTLEPSLHPHLYAFVISNIILARYPKTWPLILTATHFLQSNH